MIGSHFGQEFQVSLRKTLHSLLPAVAGFLAYGGWAVYANWSYGTHSALKAGVTQGTFSFVLTLILNLFMLWLYRLGGPQPMRILSTVLLTCLLIYSLSWGVNYLAGTPEILMTVMPGWIFSTFYALGYTLSLTRLVTDEVPIRPRNDKP